MHILHEIIERKRREVAQRKALYPTGLLERSLFFETDCVSLVSYLKDKEKSGVIAEFKRRSPSKGDINRYASVEQVTIGYMQAGASALSVLTDQDFFGGHNNDLSEARKFNYCPILRKDFTIDEYQVIEAKSIGADAILLIAACLSAEEVKSLSRLARSLGMQAVLEIHEKKELGHCCETIDVIGVNNRNLKDFSVSTSRSIDMLPYLPPHVARISESGIQDPATAANLIGAGFDGLLIGASFMQHSQPELACFDFIHRLEKIVQKGLKSSAV